MPVEFAILLGIIQGLTEFLPVSSSGHLVIVQQLGGRWVGLADVPLAFDILVHFASLLVILLFLSRECIAVPRALFSGDSFKTKQALHIIGLVLLATLPAAVVGLTAKDQIEMMFSSLRGAANGFIITTVVLLFAHLKQRHANPAHPSAEPSGVVDWRLPTALQAFLIGCAQAVAIMPGVSRSGTTIAVALLLGLPIQTAIRFSFLLAIVAIAGATVLEGKAILELSIAQTGPYLLGGFAALISSWFALRWLVQAVKASKLYFFAAYTAALSVVLHVLA